MTERRKISLKQALVMAQEATGEGDIEKATKIYEAILRKQPNNLSAKEGLSQLIKKESKHARTDLQKEAPMEKLAELGSIFTSGDFKRATLESKKIIQKFPGSVMAYNLWGVSQKKLGNYQEAVRVFDKAIQLHPSSSDFHYNRGNALKDQGNLEAAFESYKKALKFKPGCPDINNNIGNTLRGLGKPEEALKFFEKAIKTRPGYFGTYLNKASVLSTLGEHDKTINSLNVALRLKPGDRKSLAAMGNALLAKGEMKEGLEFYEKGCGVASFDLDEGLLIRRGKSL